MSAGRQTNASSAAAALVACTILLLLGGGCRIVRDDPKREGTEQSGASWRPQEGFDAKAWTTTVWSSKVVPHFEKDAVDLGPVLDLLTRDPDAAGKKYGRRANDEGSPWNFTIRGHGKVAAANTASQAATLAVTVETTGGPREITIQIGPVVKGTAVRDSLPFFSFGDVTNQIEFAQVARALNERALAGLSKEDVTAATKPGTTVEFVGAMNVPSPDDDSPWLVMPVSLKPEGASR
jgi:predicted lipoprotein